MRQLGTRFLLLVSVLFCCSLIHAQNFTFNCTKDTTLNFCNNVQCITLKSVIPDIHGKSTTYTINPTSTIAGCFPVYSAPNDNTGTPTNLTIDDKYSGVIDIGFPFTFYDSLCTQLVASTNGYVSFDITKSGAGSHYQILNNSGVLSATSGTPLDLPSSLYDKALIMGPYHDLDPSQSTSSTRRIQYTVVGTAPQRRWILSFYRVPLFQCTNLIENTHQIVLYESTGIIEVLIFDKAICTGWNQGRAMIGIQNFTRDNGVMVTNRKASSPPWGGTNMQESYRFVPSSGPSLFKRVELYDLSGTLISTGTTAPAGNGQLEVSFPSLCPPIGTTSYIVKSVYQKADDLTAEIYGADTVRVTRTTSTNLNATASMTPAACGPNGNITVTVASGIGTPPFAYALDGGAPVNTPDRTYTFTGLSAGSHTIVVTDASGCSSTVTITVTTSGVLQITPVVQPTSCQGAANGSITINPQNGVAPFQYQINGGGFGPGNTFTGLPPGTYLISVKDASGCVLNDYPVTVQSGAPLAPTWAINPPSCSGAANGSITINAPANGQAPFQYQINGGGFGPGNVFSDLAAGGPYIISIKDAQGCSINIALSVPAGTGNLNATATATGTSCPGANNGSITIQAQSGSGPYQYSLNGGAFQPGNVATGLAAGSYSVVLKDGAGCTSAPIDVTVSAGTALLATTTTTNASCSGVNNGIIIVTPTNGSGPYQYKLDGGTAQSDSTFLNVSAGPHTIIVSDGAGCISASINVTVGVAAAVTGTASVTATSCNGASDGQVSITPANGISPYQYSLDGGTFQITPTFIGLTAATHTVVVKDAVGCISSSISFVVAPGAVLTGTATSTSTSCTGVSNGTITVTFSGTPAQVAALQPQYSIDGGAYQSSNIFTGVSAGSHQAVIKSINGCQSAPITVTVGVAATVTGTPAVTATSCNGASDGQVSITPTNGTSPYQYSVDGGTFQTTPSFTGLTATSHSFVIKDAVGCTSSPVSFTITPGATLTGTATSTPTSCTGVSNGTITVTFSGTPAQVAAFQPQYSLDGGTYQSSNVFNGVSSGSHQAVIKSINGCQSAPITVSVVVGPPLTATYTATSTSCSGANNGTITVQPQATGGPFQYSLDGGTFQSSPTFGGLAAGTYSIVMKDALGCSTNPIPATVPPGQPITATTTVTDVLCNGGSTGTVTLTVPTSATPPILYSLDNVTFQTPATFNGLAAGSYTAYFKDNNGCAGTKQFTVIEPAVLNATAALRPVACNGQSNGLIRVTPSGGTAPYQYSINGTSYQPQDSFLVAAGTYTVYIKDSHGCIKQLLPQIISEPAVLTATTTAANSTCAGGSDGKITVTASGGTAGYQYSVNGGAYQSSNVFNVLAGSYAVTVKDANGCSFTLNQTVSLTNNLVVTPGVDTTICEGLGVALYPNTNATQFSWQPGTGLSSPTAQQPVASPKVTTEYILTATLGVCSAKDTVVVNVNSAPIPDAGPAGDICFGQTYVLQGSGGVSYQWTPATDFVTTTNINQPTVAPKQTTQYSLSVVDAKGCRSLQDATVKVVVTPPIFVQISKDTVVAYGDVFQLHAASVATNYEWSPAYGLDDPTKPNPIVTVTGDVLYTVTATTSAGCVGTASVQLKVYQGPEIYVATAFTPNNDGKNDVFKPFPVGIKQYNYFRVFNRWGQMVFSTRDFNQGWDGKMNGHEQPAGTYIWIVEGITKEDKIITHRGSVVLIR
jgi:gliding motility-associated-like protein